MERKNYSGRSSLNQHQTRQLWNGDAGRLRPGRPYKLSKKPKEFLGLWWNFTAHHYPPKRISMHAHCRKLFYYLSEREYLLAAGSPWSKSWLFLSQPSAVNTPHAIQQLIIQLSINFKMITWMLHRSIRQPSEQPFELRYSGKSVLHRSSKYDLKVSQQSLALVVWVVECQIHLTDARAIDDDVTFLR